MSGSLLALYWDETSQELAELHMALDAAEPGAASSRLEALIETASVKIARIERELSDISDGSASSVVAKLQVACRLVDTPDAGHIVQRLVRSAIRNLQMWPEASPPVAEPNPFKGLLSPA